MQASHAGSRNIAELLQVAGFERGGWKAATMREPHSRRGVIWVGRNRSYHPVVRGGGISVTDSGIREVGGLAGLRLSLRTTSPTWVL